MSTALAETPPATIPFHPLANVFPLMEGDAFRDLVDDVRANGLREAIWLHPDGSILDGRNRYRACLAAGVDPRFLTWEDDGSAVGFVVSLNLHRRHLDESQRAMLGARLRPLFADEARARQRGGQGGHLLPANLPEANGETRQRAARAVNVSARSVESASRVLRTGAPAVVALVDGGDVSVSAAATVAALPAELQEEIGLAGAVQVTAAASAVRAGASVVDIRTRFKAGQLPSPKEANRLARAMGRPVPASDGHVYEGRSPEEDQANEELVDVVGAAYDCLRELGSLKRDGTQAAKMVPEFMVTQTIEATERAWAFLEAFRTELRRLHV